MSRSSLVDAPLLLIAILAPAGAANAEQKVIAEASYTHSAETTSDSHYRVTPREGTPTNWQSPIDYTKGTVHITLEVKTKPAGDTQTKFQICFEATPDYACTEQSPIYTQTGKVEWTSPFANFWYGGEVDWSQGVRQIALILKDTANGKPAGDPKYMPTDLRVEVALLSAGSTYVPSAAAAGSGGSGGGSGAAGSGAGAGAGESAGRGGAAGAAGSNGGAGAHAADGGAGQSGAAGKDTRAAGDRAAAPVTPLPAAVAGDQAGSTGQTGGADAAAAPVGSETSAQSAQSSSDSGCRATGSSSRRPQPWTTLGLIAAVLVTRKRRTRPMGVS